MRVPIKFTIGLLIAFITFSSQNAAGQIHYNPFYQWKNVTQEVTKGVNYQDFETISQYRQKIYSSKGNAFLKLYDETGDYNFLIFALNEFTLSQVRVINDTLSTERYPPQVAHHLDKLLNRNYSPEMFDGSAFKPSDLYIFHYVPLPENLNSKIIDQLEEWENEMVRIQRTDPLRSQLMATTIGFGYYRLRKYDKVHDLLEYIPENHLLPASHAAFFSLRRFAYASYDICYYRSALEIYRDYLIPLADEMGDIEEYLKIRMEYANTLFRLGYVLDALEQYEYVYHHPEELRDERYISALQNNLAITYLNAGNFSNYIDFQLNAYETAIDNDDFEHQLYILRNLFIYHRRQNEHSLAISYLTQALELAEERNLINDLPVILVSLGVYHREVTKDYDQALDALEQAVEIANESDNYLNLQHASIQLSEMYFLMGQYEKSIDYLKQIQELSELREDDTSLAEIIFRLARAYFYLGDTDKASDTIKQTDEMDLVRLRFNIRIMGYNIRNQIAAEIGNDDYALESSRTIIPEILDWLRDSADLQTGHMRMDPEFTEAFSFITSTLVKKGKYTEALTWLEELRNITRSGFYNNPLLKSRVLTEDELILDFELSNRIQRLRNEYRSAEGDDQVRIGNQLVEAVAEKNRLKARVFQATEDAIETADLRNVQRKLGRRDIVLYTNVFGDQLLIGIISRNEITFQIIENSAEIKETVNLAAESLSSSRVDLELLHEVYTSVFKDIIPENTRHIYYIPDGVFYRLPIEVLPVEPVRSAFSYGSAKYLIESYAVSYLNSLTDLIDLNETRTESFDYDFAGFGISRFQETAQPQLSDLPFAVTEVNSAKNALTNLANRTVRTDTDGNESEFRQLAHRSRILHVATHSEVSDSNPLFSVIYMHGDQSNGDFENDGLIHAYELFELNLNNELVVLSSCESGAGGYLQGAGILGLSRALTYAGAQSLVMNLWPVRDHAASEISTLFYENLNAGMSKSEALRKARVHFLNTSNSNPNLWGSLVLYGNKEPIVRSSRFPLTWILAGTALLAIVLLIGYRRRA